VLIDGPDVHGNRVGNAHAVYGIGEGGALVVVRPDGYVGTVLPLAEVAEVAKYFGSFWLS
jgi:phenol 2-monooxygenase